MNEFCYSCGAPLWMPDFKGPVKNHCKYCVDDDGKIKPKEEIQNGIAEWLKGWQPDLNQEKAVARAEHYMKAMPAWAE